MMTPPPAPINSDNVADPGSGPLPADSTSSSLLDKVKVREETAWRQLLQVYGRLVLYWCHRAGLKQDAAQDLMQDVFITVLKRIDEFQKRYERGGFRAWLREITRLKILEYGKRAKDLDGVGGSAAEFLGCLRWLAITGSEHSPDVADFAICCGPLPGTSYRDSRKERTVNLDADAAYLEQCPGRPAPNGTPNSRAKSWTRR
jgi:RNA polymerase sigma factor (sigma-70 family)